MTDRICLTNMIFEGRHGVLPEERQTPQSFEVDVELWLDLKPAGLSDDLAQTVDYRDVTETCRQVIEGPSVSLIEALAESIARRVLSLPGAVGVSEVVVRVRKPAVILGAPVDYAAVEIRRKR
jgi:dihydroneopterin aldolase